MKTIFFVTSAEIPDLTEDDRLAVGPLAALGIRALPAVWTDPHRDWSAASALVLRSCWDYHLRFDEFLAWLTSLEQAGVKVWNPPQTLRWNANKIYLREIEMKGIPIIPTYWPDTSVPLKSKLAELGWQAAVIKPRVSATAHRTCLASGADLHQAQSLLDSLVEGPGAMVQKFIESIRSQGEWSLMFLAGRFSHAVIKTPQAGDFRVQHEFGGSACAAVPPRPVLDIATRAVEAVAPSPLYARVDGVEDNGQFLLMELELIEPALFLAFDSQAPSRFAQAIAGTVSRNGRS